MDFKSLRNFSFIKNPKSWIVGGIALIGAAAMIEPKLRLEATNMGGTDTDEASLRTKEYAQSLFGSETENFLQKQKLDGLMKEWFDENPDDVMTRKQFAKLKRQSFGAEDYQKKMYQDFLDNWDDEWEGSPPTFEEWKELVKDAEEKSWDDYPDEFVDEVYPYDSHPNADTYDMDDVEREYRKWERLQSRRYPKPDIREMMRNPSATYTLWQRFTEETGITDVNTVWRIVHNPWKWEGDLLAWANDEDIHRKSDYRYEFESETQLMYFTAPFNIKFDTRKEANAWVRDYQMVFKYPLKVRKMSGEHYVMYGLPWEYFDAEDWGGDPDGPLAKALARARAKSKEPRKPLKIVKLPHKDQKSLQDFGAENDNRQLEVTDQDYFGKNMDTASEGKMRIWHHNGLPRGEGIDTEEIVDRFAFRINKGMKVPLKYYEPVADIKVPYGDVFAATQNDFYDNGWLNSDIVEEVWTDEPQARSTSVGDVIHLYDKDLWFVVAPIGFLELDPMGDFKAEYGLSAENTINYGHLHNNMAADTRRFMKPTDVIDAFKKADGSLVSITFIKRTTGEVRKMLARTGVRKGVKGVGLKFNPRNKNLIGVYDFDKVREGADPSKCYRFVPIDAVISMKVRGKTYTA
ncbi:MAG: hypothetical protein CL833_09685 [Crocinitomicaceae bacterium]|nr:hypothetical protein [Crocinitomicaceae bacterium]